MKPYTSLLVCFALLGAVATSSGQDGTVRERTFGNGILSDHVAMYDIDNSGGLSVEEYQVLQTERNNRGRHQTVRSRWDINRDGRISIPEREAAKTEIRHRIEQRRLRRFNEVDRNSDGFLIEQEFLAINAVAVSDLGNPGVGTDLFKYLDHNGDERISQAEFLRSLNSIRPAPLDPQVKPKPRLNADGEPPVTPGGR